MLFESFKNLVFPFEIACRFVNDIPSHNQIQFKKKDDSLLRKDAFSKVTIAFLIIAYGAELAV